MDKILFVLHLPPPVHGAAMVGDYVKKSTAINAAFHSKFINLSTSHSLGEIGKGGVVKLLRYLKMLYSVYKEVTNFKPDLIYITLSSAGFGILKDSLIVFLVKLLTRKKIVFHMHNAGVNRFQDRALYNFVYSKVFKNTTVIVLSKYLKKDVSKYVKDENIRICANGLPKIDVDHLVVRDKQQGAHPRILFLSNLIEQKGVYVLLKACQILKKKDIDFSCVYVGNEGDIFKEDLNNEIRNLDLEDQVTYLGPKFGDDKYREFAKADIFAFPTYYDSETFGLVNVEAMQFSLPIISTAIGGVPDVIENNVSGYLVQIKNEVEVAEKLAILIKNPDLRRIMGEKGYSNYQNKFTLEIFEQSLIKIFKELLLEK